VTAEDEEIMSATVGGRNCFLLDSNLPGGFRRNTKMAQTARAERGVWLNPNPRIKVIKNAKSD